MNYTQDWLTDKIPHFLAHLSQFKDKDVGGMEIGVFEGRTSQWLTENILTHPDAKLVCVDPLWDIHVRKRCHDNLKDNPKITLLQHPSNLISGPPDKLAFCYIDGDHCAHQVLLDACRAWVWLAKDGILMLDDYLLPHKPTKPKEAIDAFLKCMKGKYELLHKDNLVILKKL